MTQIDRNNYPDRRPDQTAKKSSAAAPIRQRLHGARRQACGFFYLVHRTVDAKHAIITDTDVTPASMHDSQPYLARLDRQCKRVGLRLQAVGLNAGYLTQRSAKQRLRVRFQLNRMDRSKLSFCLFNSATDRCHSQTGQALTSRRIDKTACARLRGGSETSENPGFMRDV